MREGYRRRIFPYGAARVDGEPIESPGDHPRPEPVGLPERPAWLGKPGDILVAERACERLIIRYAHLVDFGNAADVADLFTVDGVWEGPTRRWVGRNQIRQGFRARDELVDRRSRHVCSPILVTVTGPREATGLTYVVLFSADGPTADDVAGPVDRWLVGEYQDRFRYSQGAWLFAHRQAFVEFSDPPPRR